MVKNIYLDLDGTIIDAFPRLYAVYKDLLLSLNEKYLPYLEYRSLKRSGLSEEEILEKTVGDLGKVKKILIERIGLLEQTRYLEKDRALIGVREILEEMRRHFKLYVVTQRRNRNNLLKQLRQLGLSNLFEEILSSVDRGQNDSKKDWGDKLKLIFNRKGYKTDENVIIGDSIDDTRVAHALNFKVIGVLTGVSSECVFLKAKPDFVVSDMREVMRILNG